jgi:hypothetical protein
MNPLFTIAQDVRIIEGFGGTEWANQTQLHPLALAMTIVNGLALVLLPRRYSIWPILVMLCFVAPAQRLVVAGLDFNLIRLMVLFGAVRVLIRREFLGIRVLPIDVVMIAFILVRAAVYTAQWGNSSSLIYQLGQGFDGLGMYALFRCLLRSWDDVVRTTIGFIVLSVPVLICFAIEHQTGRNMFSVFGGVPEFTQIREGRMRCQGAFAHPIIAGCFWASMLPLVTALWWRGSVGRVWCMLGTGTMLGIVILTASSTPITAVAFGVFGWVMFLARRYMGWVILGTTALLVMLHMVMKAPVWHLISRIQITAGNTGYHRFMLIDSAIRRFDEWALLGTRTTAHWFWGGQDVTNQYVLEGVTGGAITLVLFIVTLVLAFRMVGVCWRSASGSRAGMLAAWSIGVMFFVHATNFIGVSYFGQATPLWYMHLAIAASMYEAVRRASRGRAATSPPPVTSRSRFDAVPVLPVGARP